MAETLTLLDGLRIPTVGFGLYKVPAAEAEQVARDGITVGYRLIDGGRFYGNEAELGRAIRDSGLREQLVVTSKFWGDPEMSYDATLRDFAASEADLGIGPIDIYMIHWPRPAHDAYVDVWRAMVELQAEGRIRSIGVSNFNQQQITRLMAETGVTPAINQVESHPWLPQHELREFHRRHGIVTQAWSPLGRGGLLAEPTVVEVAKRHGATPAQVLIRWQVEMGGGVVVKSVTPERLRSNLDVDGLRLDTDDMARLATLANGRRSGSHPDKVN